MRHFVSTFRNKIDGKGRVSMPAQFRAALGDGVAFGINLIPALEPGLECIEGWPVDRMQKLVDKMDAKLESMGEDAEDLADFILMETKTVNIEDNGRIHVPPEMVAEGGFQDIVVFVGRGDHFQMWEAERFAIYRKRLEAVKRPGANRLIRRIISSGREAQ